jgi:hypothetical protein
MNPYMYVSEAAKWYATAEKADPKSYSRVSVSCLLSSIVSALFLYMVCKHGSVGSVQEQRFKVRNLNRRYP